MSGIMNPKSRMTWCSWPSKRRTFSTNWSKPLAAMCRIAILKTKTRGQICARGFESSHVVKLWLSKDTWQKFCHVFSTCSSTNLMITSVFLGVTGTFLSTNWTTTIVDTNSVRLKKSWCQTWVGGKRSVKVVLCLTTNLVVCTHYLSVVVVVVVVEVSPPAVVVGEESRQE